MLQHSAAVEAAATSAAATTHEILGDRELQPNLAIVSATTTSTPDGQVRASGHRSASRRITAMRSRTSLHGYVGYASRIPV